LSFTEFIAMICLGDDFKFKKLNQDVKEAVLVLVYSTDLAQQQCCIIDAVLRCTGQAETFDAASFTEDAVSKLGCRYFRVKGLSNFSRGAEESFDVKCQTGTKDSYEVTTLLQDAFLGGIFL
jgi:hypothetical protein